MPALEPFLDLGIPYASVNYRLAPEHPLPTPRHDAARAIQFLRTKATDRSKELKRIPLTEPIAGACTAVWLLLHDDPADAQVVDPVRRESTRVCLAAVMVAKHRLAQCDRRLAGG